MKKLIFLNILLFFILSCNRESNTVQKEEKAKKNQTEIEEPGISSEKKLFWHWEDNFTTSEKTKIKKYITKVTEATFTILGTYPFDVHYYFERSDSKTEPIPWAHTERGKRQGVRFYINPDFDYEVLYADWTAPHEISHLAIPYLGKENSWFSEGYASYMQYQIMQEMGIYTPEEVGKKYQEKIKNIQGDYSNELVFVENANALRSRHNYRAMYWGGARYFMEINQYLTAQEETSLNDWMKKYQSCCRGKDKNIKMLLQTLDKDLKAPVFTNLYNECNSKSFEEIYKSE